MEKACRLEMEGTASEPLEPCDARLMQCYSLSTRINRTANDDAESCAPLKRAENQNRLFPCCHTLTFSYSARS
jgi:hypothetical protein